MDQRKTMLFNQIQKRLIKHYLTKSAVMYKIMNSLKLNCG